MTPQRIADISEPIEQLYSDLTDELLINIAKHLSKSTATWSALHEIETLQEMGQLTEENIKIINDYVKRMPKEIKDAMNESRLEALGEIEKKLADAAADGYLTQPVTDGTVEVAQALSNQAAEQLNLVNQTMLNSSLQAYQTGVYEFRQEMNNLAIKTIETEQQLEVAQNELNKAAASVVAGTENRTVALRKCIRKLNDTGIIGYYDRLNRAWTAEAYVNMNIRTTVHNTYIKSIQTRQQEYGSDVFQVSAHAGARPLCYPYQGKFYSWSGRSGEITLGDGKKYPFEPISVTSYGEPAGLFGINCGHVPYPMIQGVSEPVKEDIQSEAENTKEYQESQQQRLLEREIRRAKRYVELLGDAADEQDKGYIKEAQAKMREFIEQTGRTRRYDREQIVTKKNTPPPTAMRPKIEKTQRTIDKIDIGSALNKSLGKEAKEYIGVLEKTPDRIKALYTDFSNKLDGAQKKTNGGAYTPYNTIEWDYQRHGSKWGTLAHEYGHFADARLGEKHLIPHTEADKINEAIGLTTNVKPVRDKISSSDKFLAALRADRELNASYVTDSEARKKIHDTLLADRDATAGVQDCFDGWFGTQKSTDSSYRLPWGHGDKYYNRFYSRWVNDKIFNKKEAVKQAYKDMGFEVKNLSQLKKICRDYDTASELWANIASAMTCEENVLKYYKEFTPNSLNAFIEITEGYLNGDG